MSAAKTERTYLAAADILRVFAIAFLGWYHIWQQSWLDPSFRIGSIYVNLQQVVRHGYILVDVLLVISGFLLALPYARTRLGLGRRPDFKQFYVKRFWRIVPSYVLAVLLCLFLWAIPEGRYSSPRFLIKDVLTHLTFTHNLFYDTYFTTPLPIVLWTMGVEVQFYLLFPLAAALYEALPKTTCLTLTLAALAFRAWVYFKPDTAFWVNQLPGMLDLYACGMLAALVYTRLSQKPPRRGRAWLTGAAALLAILLLTQFMYWQPVGEYEQMRRYQLLFRLPIGVVSGAFLVCGCLLPAGASCVLGNPVVRFLSAVSYNFYIWHQHIAVRLKLIRLPPYANENPNMAGEQPWQTQYTLLCFAAAVAVAAIITYLWEKPVNGWGLTRWRKKHERSEAAEASVSA